MLSLVDFKTPRTIWGYSKPDFAALAATAAVTLLLGVEPGVIAGVALSLALFLWRSSRPHAAIVGRVPGTEHFRNVKRHKVITLPHVLTIRIDEALTYLNARWLESLCSRNRRAPGAAPSHPDVPGGQRHRCLRSKAWRRSTTAWPTAGLACTV